MYNPQPKPVKAVKAKSTIKKVSAKPKFFCSNGDIVSQLNINNRLADMRKDMMIKDLLTICQAYQIEANDFDHTISQKRCKELNKTELIWNPDNISISSRLAHTEWENYASGEFEDHKNVVIRMKYVKLHDHEMFQKRFNRLSNYNIMKQL